MATYSATDPESATITWSLEGDDAADFEISAGGELTFKSSPDHEAAADADTDNTYEASTGGGLSHRDRRGRRCRRDPVVTIRPSPT